MFVEGDRGFDIGIVRGMEKIESFWGQGGSLAMGADTADIKHIIRHASAAECAQFPLKDLDEQYVTQVKSIQ